MIVKKTLIRFMLTAKCPKLVPVAMQHLHTFTPEPPVIDHLLIHEHFANGEWARITTGTESPALTLINRANSKARSSHSFLNLTNNAREHYIRIFAHDKFAHRRVHHKFGQQRGHFPERVYGRVEYISTAVDINKKQTVVRFTLFAHTVDDSLVRQLALKDVSFGVKTKLVLEIFCSRRLERFAQRGHQALHGLAIQLALLAT
mmetsp:Transcript_6939/g.13854  ORF Transcript_6939/g.13854 Transcript_6939/m.13854 type:complete len:203 (-) Transcript_6939:74-682(-)